MVMSRVTVCAVDERRGTMSLGSNSALFFWYTVSEK
jgi:hypothetical protein